MFPYRRYTSYKTDADPHGYRYRKQYIENFLDRKEIQQIGQHGKPLRHIKNHIIIDKVNNAHRQQRSDQPDHHPFNDKW